MNRKLFKYLFTFFIIVSLISTTFILSECISAADNTPKGYEPYYMRGYTFNVPSSFKQVDEGFNSASRMNYMNFKKGNKFVNISLERHSSKFNKNLMDTFSAFTWNGLDHYQTTISGISGFYSEKNKVKSFVFASEDDMIYIKAKGVKLSKVLSSIKQKNYKSYHNSEYDFDDDAYYESDAYDDSFDDSFDDAGYYSYNW